MPESQSLLEIQQIVEKQLECTLCFSLLVEPVTTECGHTFCKQCLHLSSLHSACCPVCRTRLSGRLPATNTIIQALLEECMGDKYKARLAETKSTKKNQAPLNEESTLGLFILDCVLPRQHLKLHVFEPRYRRLIARTLEKTPPLLGMVAMNESQLSSVVSECEIIDHTALPDGRFLCEVVGRRRLRLRRDWESHDGYRIAAVQEWTDDPLTTEEHTQVEEISIKLKSDIDLWIQKVKETSWHTRRQLLDLVLQHLASPPVDDPEAFGLWITALINPLPPLGLAPEIRLEALTQSSSISRLRLCQRTISISLAHLNQRTNIHRSLLGFLLFVSAQFLSFLIRAISRTFVAPIALINRLLLGNDDNNNNHLGIIGRVHLPLEGVGQ